MLKLMDLISEAAQLSPYQIFSPGTGGKHLTKNWKFDPSKIPTGKLKVGNQMACSNKPIGGFWTSSYLEYGLFGNLFPNKSAYFLVNLSLRKIFTCRAIKLNCSCRRYMISCYAIPQHC